VRFRDVAQTAALKLGKNEFALIDIMFRHPLIDARTAERELNVTFATANTALSNLLGAGLVSETTGKARNRVYRFDAYLQLFEETPPTLPSIYRPPSADTYLHGEAGSKEIPRT